MIPVLGIPVVNRPDLLFRCLNSIDYSIELLTIINNGTDKALELLLEEWKYAHGKGMFMPMVENFTSMSFGRNLGVATSWNTIIAETPAEYWELVGSDIEFSPGDLKKIDLFVREHLDMVTMPANWGHSLFAVTKKGWEVIGAFDQNFFPAYSEDQDHMYRIKLSGEPWQDVPDIHAVHGEPPLWGSSTVWSDQTLLSQCKVMQPANLEYYKFKWGGYPGFEEWEHPYNDPTMRFDQWDYRYRDSKEGADGNGSINASG
jgi:hypothetical protein